MSNYFLIEGDPFLQNNQFGENTPLPPVEMLRITQDNIQRITQDNIDREVS